MCPYLTFSAFAVRVEVNEDVPASILRAHEACVHQAHPLAGPQQMNVVPTLKVLREGLLEVG